MIQNLIEGIAYYCNTQDQYRALENICYTFISPISIDHSQLSDYNPFKNRSNEYIDRELRQDRINLARSGGNPNNMANEYIRRGDNRNPIPTAKVDVKSLFQLKRDEMASYLRGLRRAKMKGSSFLVKDYTEELNKAKNKIGSTDKDKESINSINLSLERNLFDEDSRKRDDRDINIGDSLHNNYFKREKIKNYIPKHAIISGVGGSVGGAGLGVLIGNKIAKKKGWSRTKSRVIGGLLGGVAGAGLGAGGSYLYGKHRVSSLKNKINDIVDNYKKVSSDEMNKINTMYPHYKDYAEKHQLIDPNKFDDYKIK